MKNYFLISDNRITRIKISNQSIFRNSILWFSMSGIRFYNFQYEEFDFLVSRKCFLYFKKIGCISDVDIYVTDCIKKIIIISDNIQSILINKKDRLYNTSEFDTRNSIFRYPKMMSIERVFQISKGKTIEPRIGWFYFKVLKLETTIHISICIDVYQKELGTIRTLEVFK